MTLTTVPTLTFTVASSATPQLTLTALSLVGGSRALAFVSDRADGKTLQIWTAKVSLNSQGLPQGGDFTQLTFDPGDKQQPAWSPDGSRLLYVASGGTAANGQELGLDMFLLDFSQPGAAPLNLTARAGDHTDPAWSPDGKQIAFTNNGRSDKIRMIDLMNADGSGLRRLSVDLEEFSPAWSPDSQWLAFTSRRDGNFEIYLMRATGQDAPINLTLFPARDLWPTWQP